MQALNPYINYHRPCLYPTAITDKTGKKKKYDYKNRMTPYEKFKAIENAHQCLKENMTFEKLDDIAIAMTDNQAAEKGTSGSVEPKTHASAF